MDMADTRAVHRLTAIGINRLKQPGLYADGGNLYFRIAPGGSRGWVFRFTRNGRTHDAGFGPYPEIAIADARTRAFEWRKLLVSDVDPLEQRKAEQAAAPVAAAKSITFDDAVAAYLATHERGWRNAKHRQQWASTLATYASPVFGKLPVSAIDTGLVLRALEPIWNEKPITAGRLRGRIEQVLDWARVHRYRSGENPARWRGHLCHLLAAPTKVRTRAHHRAVAYGEIAGFMAELRQRPGNAARALEFTILTATRSGEVLGAKWSEIDVANRVWVIGVERMKSKREFRVALSDVAIAVLESVRGQAGEFVFQRPTGGRLGINAMHDTLGAMSRRDATVHGFRSTFRDWAAEATSYPNHVVEMALAHAIPSAVEAAYRRGDLFEKRRKLMAAWSDFCARPAPMGATVTVLREARS
jgi:integrase